jgi:WD40 repeat protein
VAVTADGRSVASGADDDTVRVWDLVTGRCAAPEGHTDYVDIVAVTADGRSAVSGSWDRIVRVWDLASGRCIATHAEGSQDARRAWAAAAGNGPFATAVEPHGLMLRNTTTGATFARFPGTFDIAACSADGRHVIAGDARGGVYLLRLHGRSM